MSGKRFEWSRRSWLKGAVGLGALTLPSLALPSLAHAKAPSADIRTPRELDRDWLKATQAYVPERRRLLDMAAQAGGPFRPDWQSLEAYTVPQWYADAKLGIFIHWGVFSVPAFGSEWYSRNMYVEGSPEFAHHVKTYGPQTAFGYKDFIPMFKAEHFAPDIWMDLFAAAGARYVVPVAEHHDGFSLYDSHLSDYTAVKMGPRRDLLGEIAQSAKAKGLHFALSSHRAEHDWFFDEGRKFPSDVSDPKNAGLYGPAQTRLAGADDNDLFGDYTYVSQAWLDDWLARQVELVERYNPDLVYFDWWIGQPDFRNTLPTFLAWYYNRAAKTGGSAIVNYKLGEFAPGAGVLDIERGQAPGIRSDVWQTCTSISDTSWGYIENDTYKSPEQIIHLLIDVVAKNGNLLLNIGPRADGHIPDAARDTLLQMGAWLKTNGEAIYGSRPWHVFGEGPTETANGTFSESRAKPYTAQDFRFTVKDGHLYALQMAWPESGSATITSIRKEQSVKAIHLLGHDAPVAFHQDDQGLTFVPPVGAPRQLAYVYRIET